MERLLTRGYAIRIIRDSCTRPVITNAALCTTVALRLLVLATFLVLVSPRSAGRIGCLLTSLAVAAKLVEQSKDL